MQASLSVSYIFCTHYSALYIHREEPEAAEEPTLDTQKLIDPCDVDIKNDKMKKRRSQSATQFKKEMETQGRVGSRDFLIKVSLQNKHENSLIR